MVPFHMGIIVFIQLDEQFTVNFKLYDIMLPL